jgi:hypothetical protein
LSIVECGAIITPMPKMALLIVGTIVLLLVTFANPIQGNVFGFCPFSEGPKAMGIDALVAVVDLTAVWLIYRGLRG